MHKLVLMLVLGAALALEQCPLSKRPRFNELNVHGELTGLIGNETCPRIVHIASGPSIVFPEPVPTVIFRKPANNLRKPFIARRKQSSMLKKPSVDFILVLLKDNVLVLALALMLAIYMKKLRNDRADSLVVQAAAAVQPVQPALVFPPPPEMNTEDNGSEDTRSL